VTLAKFVGDRRRLQPNTQSCGHVTRRSIDWKHVDSLLEPLHAPFDFTLEGCAYDEGLTSHGDFLHCSPSESILERLEWEACVHQSTLGVSTPCRSPFRELWA
jgi:hypothetical protein